MKFEDMSQWGHTSGRHAKEKKPDTKGHVPHGDAHVERQEHRPLRPREAGWQACGSGLGADLPKTLPLGGAVSAARADDGGPILWFTKHYWIVHFRWENIMICKVHLSTAVTNYFHYLCFQNILEPFVESIQKFHQYYTKTKRRKIVIFTWIILYVETCLFCCVTGIIQYVAFGVFYFLISMLLSRIMFIYSTKLFLGWDLFIVTNTIGFSYIFRAYSYHCIEKYFYIYFTSPPSAI